MYMYSLHQVYRIFALQRVATRTVFQITNLRDVNCITVLFLSSLLFLFKYFIVQIPSRDWMIIKTFGMK